MNRHDGVLAIVLSSEHLLGFAGVDHVRQFVEPVREVVEDWLTPLGPLDQDGEILPTRPQRLAEGTILFQPSAPLQQLLGCRLVLPEIGFGDALLYGCEFGCGMCGVKDSSADRMRGGRGPDTCEAVRRGLKP
jgi:hypothetical protein